MMDITLLGTGGTFPLPERALTSLYVRYEGRALLIDCGEGTQVQLRHVYSLVTKCIVFSVKSCRNPRGICRFRPLRIVGLHADKRNLNDKAPVIEEQSIHFIAYYHSGGVYLPHGFVYAVKLFSYIGEFEIKII